MNLELYFLTGFMVGFEYVAEYDDCRHLIVDLGIFRLLFSLEL
jgi:hypothetical protein